MNQIDLIQAEIERLRKDRSTPHLGKWYEGYHTALRKLSSFLATLEEEPVDLEKGIEKFLDESGAPYVWCNDEEQKEWCGIIAKHFYELGRQSKEQPVCGFEPKFNVGDRIQFKGFGHNKYTIAKVNVDDNRYVDTNGNGMDMSYTDANFELVKEQPVCEGLEEAAKQYVEKMKFSSIQSFEDAFKAGATWQKDKDTRDMYMSDNRHFQKIYELGRKEEREQMMAEAVEYILFQNNSGETYIPSIKLYNGKAGDKVKLIIIKED